MTETRTVTLDAIRIDRAQAAYALRGRRAATGFRLNVENFRVGPGERVALVGPSGSGKSTLLGLVAGTMVPASGTVHVLGENLSAMRSGARDRFRATRLGVVFQQFNLLPWASAAENVCLPARLAGSLDTATRRRAHELLEALEIEAHLHGAKAAELSVGQQQRVAAARAFLMRPGLVIADEPTSALDTDRRDAFLDLLFDQGARDGSALLLVTHDLALGARFERTVAMGEIAHGALTESVEAAA